MRALIEAAPLELLLAAHAAATWWMAGVIWMVQLVHYPLMARVGAAQWSEYQRGHMRAMTPVVLPAMVLELGCAAWLALDRRTDSSGLEWVGLVLAAGIWASTFWIQVPLHERLARGFEAELHRRLTSSNWLRTAAWSARAVIATVLLM